MDLAFACPLVAGAGNTRSRKTGQPHQRGLAFFVSGPIEVPAWEQACGYSPRNPFRDQGDEP